MRAIVRIAAVFLPVLVLFSCGQQEQPKAPEPVKLTEEQEDSLRLVTLGEKVLKALKKNDFKELTSFTDPMETLRFSPYSYLDSTNPIFTGGLTHISPDQTFNWGYHDGTGEPIRMTVKDYFKRFVYDQDYLKAPKVSVNRTLGTGNSIDNLKEIYPDADYVEYYFPGFKEEYGGMDWRSLKLVFRKKEGHFYLAAIVHSEWTI